MKSSLPPGSCNRRHAGRRWRRAPASARRTARRHRNRRRRGAARPAARRWRRRMAGPPVIPARTWVLIDFGSGQTLAEHNADQRIEPASLTKLMCAYAVFSALRDGRLKMNETVLISEHAWRAEGSRTFVQVGTRVPVDVLVKGMIIQSGQRCHDCAGRAHRRQRGRVRADDERLRPAARHARHAFRGLERAAVANHYSTARDLATLSRAIIRDFPQYYGIFAMREFTWNNIRQENRNGLLERDPSVDGIKTGHTDTAGYCLISSALRSGMRLISVVLGSPSVQARGIGQRRAAELRIQFLRNGRRQEGRRDGVEAARLQRLRAIRRRGSGHRRAGDRAARPGAAPSRCAATCTSPLIAPLAANAAIGAAAGVGGRKDSWPRVPLYPVARSRRGRPVATPGRHHHPLVLGHRGSLHGRAAAGLLPQRRADAAARGAHLTARPQLPVW